MEQTGRLTRRQRQVFDSVQTRAVETGSATTLESTRSHFSFDSSNSSRQHLRLITPKGYLQLLPGRARGIRLTRQRTEQPTVSLVPLVGRIAVGDPIWAIKDIETTIPLPSDLLHGDDLFALRVHGDSMIGAGTFNGDLAIENAQPVAENGTIAAFVIRSDVTVKRYFRSAHGVRPRAENARYSDLVFVPEDSNDVRIAGILAGTLRTF